MCINWSYKLEELCSQPFVLRNVPFNKKRTKIGFFWVFFLKVGEVTLLERKMKFLSTLGSSSQATVLFHVIYSKYFNVLKIFLKTNFLA